MYEIKAVPGCCENVAKDRNTSDYLTCTIGNGDLVHNTGLLNFRGEVEFRLTRKYNNWL